MDPDGSLGLRTAPDALLLRARDRTRSYPRALEALAAILATDRDTTLIELLTETERLPDNVVHALVGEAFTRLDPLAQQVMQTLAVYTVPVPSVAVDYLLQPYRAAVDAAPVFTRLVRYQSQDYNTAANVLHEIDFDYLTLWGHYRLRAREIITSVDPGVSRVLAGSGRNGVVPVAVQLVSGQVSCLELCHLLVRDLDAFRVDAGIGHGADRQPGFGGGRCDRLDDDLVGFPRAASPVHRDVAEQPVFDAVPLRRSRMVDAAP